MVANGRQVWKKCSRRQVLLRVALEMPLTASPLSNLPGLRSDRIVFVQLGANEGSPVHAACGDPIYDLAKRHSWSGFAVEPNPRVYPKLQRFYNFSQGRVRTLNIGVADADGELTLYVPSGLTSEWVSAQRSHAHGKSTRRIRVPALSIETLWRRHVVPSVSHVDVLNTDLEGFDHVVLRATNFTALGALRPRWILWEHSHTSAANQSATNRHLAAHGYSYVKQAPCGRAGQRYMVDTLLEWTGPMTGQRVLSEIPR